MPLHFAGFEITFSTGLAAVTVKLDNRPSTAPAHPTPREPARLVELSRDARAALAELAFDTTRERILFLGLELGGEAMRNARVLAARLRGLQDAHARAATPDGYEQTQRLLIRDLFDFIDTAESTARGGNEDALPALTLGPVDTRDTSDDGASPIVAAHAISLAAGGRWIIKSVDVELFPGEIVALVGKNGAGKTTLMRVLGGEISSKGQVVIAESAPRGRDDIAYSAQRPTPFSGSVVSTLTRFAALRALGPTDVAAEVDYALELLDLVGYRDSAWEALSSGYRTRFELAKSLVANPRVLLLDEPLGPLDHAARSGFMRTLRDLARSKRQAAILVSTQELDTVEDFVDRVVVLQRGSVRFSGPPHTIGDQFDSSLFELRVRAGTAELETALRHLTAVVAAAGELYRVTTAPEADAADVLDALREAGLVPVYFRDLTHSLIRLFEASAQ